MKSGKLLKNNNIFVNINVNKKVFVATNQQQDDFIYFGDDIISRSHQNLVGFEHGVTATPSGSYTFLTKMRVENYFLETFQRALKNSLNDWAIFLLVIFIKDTSSQLNIITDSLNIIKGADSVMGRSFTFVNL